MTDTAYSPDHDEPINYYPTPHRHLVAAAGRLARAAQQRLEQQLRLQDGRTPRPD